MIRLFLPLFLCLSCTPTPEDAQELRAEIAQLEVDRERTRHERDALFMERESLLVDVQDLQQQVAQLAVEAKGGEIRYILKVRLSQSHLSLDPLVHAKDALNAVDFELVTDRTSFHAANPGQALLESFRGGSALLNGSWGDWEITVIGKRTEEVRP